MNTFKKKGVLLMMVAAVLLTVVSFASCKPKDVYKDLALEKEMVELVEGEATTVSITAGSGSYTIAVNDEAVVRATLEGTTITIEAIKSGSTLVTVTDTKTEQKKTITASCKSKDGAYQDLALEKEEVELSEGETTTVSITAGSGFYTIVASDEAIAKAILENATITIKAIKAGSTSITVTDTKTEQKKTIAAKVRAEDPEEVPSVYIETSFTYDEMRFGIDAAEEDRADIWVDWNNNGVKDEGEDTFEAYGEEIIVPTSNEYTIYGKVTYIHAYIQEVSEIKIDNPYIKYLNLGSHNLSELDVTGLPLLEKLVISSNGSDKLRELDLTKNPKLKYLDCSAQQGIQSLDLSENTELEKFMMKSLSSRALSISSVKMGSHKNMKEFDLWYSNALESLSFNDCPELERISFEGCEALNKVDISGAPKLKLLSVSGTSVNTIDLSKHTELESLYMFFCGISDASFLNKLPNPEKLVTLLIQDNEIDSETLDISKMTGLVDLRCYRNNITGEKAVKLFKSLPARTGAAASIFFVDRPVGPGMEDMPPETNKATTAAVKIATDKNWKVMDKRSNQSGVPATVYEGEDD